MRQSRNLLVPLALITCYGILSILVSHWHIVVDWDETVSTDTTAASLRASAPLQDGMRRPEKPKRIAAPVGSTAGFLKTGESSKPERTKIHHCQYGDQTVTMPTAPYFLIVGAQRSGTSALADLLRDHPDIVGPSINHTKRPFEPHYFDWDFPSAEQRQQLMQQHNETEQELFCRYRHQYAQMFDSSMLLENLHLVAFEKTPSYLFHSHIPSLILRTCPWKPKIVVILRNPIDRAFSHHNAQVQQKGNRSFEELLDHEVSEMHKVGLSNAPSLHELVNGTADFEIPHMSRQQLAAAHKRLYRQVHLVNYLQRSVYWTQLLHWKEVLDDSHLLVLQYERLYSPNTAQDEYDRLLRFLNVSKYSLPTDQQHTRSPYKSALSENTRKYLELFFLPHNSKLAEVLGDTRWKGVWQTGIERNSRGFRGV